jgi:membrane complex biogenesis BtpA family protein
MNKSDAKVMKTSLFKAAKPVIGVIHVGALPGTPANRLSVGELAKLAAVEAKLYRDGGVDGIIIENMHDVPYLRGAVGPEIVAAMTVIGQTVKSVSLLPAGIQILAAANIEALAVAHAAQLDFIRVEGYVFAHVADEGIIESSAAKLLRYRKLIGAQRVEVWADIKKKHSAHAITADISLAATAEAVEFMRGDAVIVSGNVTGEAPKAADIQEAKAHCRLPVILGSGIDATNIKEFYPLADGFIIGTAFKKDAHWANGVDRQRVKRLIRSIERLRS